MTTARIGNDGTNSAKGNYGARLKQISCGRCKYLDFSIPSKTLVSLQPLRADSHAQKRKLSAEKVETKCNSQQVNVRMNTIEQQC